MPEKESIEFYPLSISLVEYSQDYHLLRNYYMLIDPVTSSVATRPRLSAVTRGATDGGPRAELHRRACGEAGPSQRARAAGTPGTTTGRAWRQACSSAGRGSGTLAAALKLPQAVGALGRLPSLPPGSFPQSDPQQLDGLPARLPFSPFSLTQMFPLIKSFAF